MLRVSVLLEISQWMLPSSPEEVASEESMTANAVIMKAETIKNYATGYFRERRSPFPLSLRRDLVLKTGEGMCWTPNRILHPYGCL